jgi:hypothetical protein
MIASATPSPLDQWRQRFGGRRRQHARPRPAAALGYLTNGPVLDGLIEVEKLVLVLLHDEYRGHQHALRLAGFTGACVPWGVQWGGPEHSRFLKDLRLQPVPQARGLRLDTNSDDLLRLGLQLDRELERHVRHAAVSVRQELRLPCLWAGFKPAQAVGLTGDGPELADYCQRTRRTAAQVMARLGREHYGLLIYPYPWVSHRWEQAVAVFADLARFPKRQIFALHRPADDLVGHQAAAEFDFLHSRFGHAARGRRKAASVAVANA